MLLAGNLVVVRMTSDPKPLDSARGIVTERTVMLADAHRPKLAQAFEMKRGMPRIGLEKLEVLVGNGLHGLGKRVVQRPEATGRSVLQSGRVFPALWSAIDSSMRRSSFPAAASASI